MNKPNKQQRQMEKFMKILLKHPEIFDHIELSELGKKKLSEAYLQNKRFMKFMGFKDV